MLQQVIMNWISFVIIAVNLALIVVLTNTLIQARKTRDTYLELYWKMNQVMRQLYDGRASRALAEGRLHAAEAALAVVIAEYKRAIANCEHPAPPFGTEDGGKAL